MAMGLKTALFKTRHFILALAFIMIDFFKEIFIKTQRGGFLEKLFCAFGLNT